MFNLQQNLLIFPGNFSNRMLAKICNLYVNFDTRVEKKGAIGCGLKEKGGSLGVGSA